MVRNLAIVTILLVCFLGGTFIYDYVRLPSKNITIIYTSNLRGQIKPFAGSVDSKQYDQVGGLAFIKGFIKKMSVPFNIDPDNVILLDTGDALFGTAEATLTMGEIPLKLMNKMGYDAMVIGNLEFEFGFEALKGFINSNQVPMLACNYKDISTKENPFKSSIIINKGGVNIGIIGLGQDEISRNTRSDNILNLEVSDMKSSVQKTASSLKENGAEIIILLSHHSGIASLRNLSKEFPDVDIIIGDLIGQGSVVFGEKPLVCQTAPSRGAGVGIVKIVYQNGKWQIEQGLHRIFPIDSSNIEPDSTLNQEISKFESKIDSLLDETITISKGNFKHSFMSESTIGYLIADSMKSASGADVALTNSGGIKSVISEGTVTLRNLYEILPFENNLITVELPGNELEDLVELSLSDSKSGFLQSSGIECIYSSLNPPGCRIIQIDINGKPLELNATYTVAINDFMHANSLDWPELSAGRNPKIKGMIRESFKEYLKKQASISPLTTPNYKETDEDYLIRNILSADILNLSKPITQRDKNNEYKYSFLLCEMIKNETNADFAVVPASIINKTREPLIEVSMARIFSDFKSNEGVYIVELTGKILHQIIDESLKNNEFLSFSGFSIEKNKNTFKIIPWKDSFYEDAIYKVAINENYLPSLESQISSSIKKKKRFSDIRKTFVEGLRKIDGKVDLKRAFY